MKYDGYFVLADLLGIPNLRGRATVATAELSKRMFFGIRRPNEQSRWLRTILVSYGICAAIYKWFLVIAISTMLAMQIWIIGIMVGGYYFLSSVGTTILQTVKYLLWSEELKNKRPLAISYLALITVGLPALFWFCPVPSNSHARGVIESQSINVVHVENGGFLKTACVRPGQSVTAGQTIGQLENINRVAEVNRKRTELRNLKMKFRSLQLADRVRANQTAQEIRRLQFELELQPDANAIEQVKSPVSGQVLACSHANGTGNFIAAGDELLRIGTEGWIVRAVANSQSLASVKPEVGQIVHCRFHSDPSKAFAATIQSVSLAGSRVVRHEALTHLAGGFIPVDPETLEATEPFFELTVKLTDEPPVFFRNGSICEIRFGRQYDPLGKLLYRSLLSFANQISIQ
jgi:putative peptide zinc metalloprotease protein